MSATSKSKHVLDEDTYVEQLEQIIERDFFPDLPALRTQDAVLEGHGDSTGTQLRHTAATACSTRTSDAAPNRAIHPANAARNEALEPLGWDQPTPTRDTQLTADQQSVVATPAAIEQDSTHNNNNNDSAATMTLSRFVSTHTSEDNASFHVLQEQTVAAHRERYHWAYDVDPSRGDPRLHLRSDGTWITPAQRQLVDRVLAPKGPLDNRPSAPDTWRFRARNPLLFPPELSVNRDICHAIEAPLLLENNGSQPTNRPPRAPKTTVFANSRFPALETSIQTIGDAVDAATIDSYALVDMTPRVVPGVNDASPLMTWGAIDATPFALEARVSTPARTVQTPLFELPETPVREQLANRLEAQTRRRKSSQRSESTSRKRSRADARSPTLSTGRRSVRERLSSMTSRSALRTPFGADVAELRASYATPVRRPPLSSGSSSMRHAATPRTDVTTRSVTRRK